jgi:hypothetical protein
MPEQRNGWGGYRPGAGRKAVRKAARVGSAATAHLDVKAQPVKKSALADLEPPSKSELYALLAEAAANTAKLPRPE